MNTSMDTPLSTAPLAAGSRRRLRTENLWPLAFSVLFLLAGSVLLGRRTYLWVKGEIAERRIEAVLAQYLEDGAPRRPWPWADFHPIARLEISRLGVRRSVIEGASGTSLAFAVGHVDGTSRPGERGNVVLAGHRDGAFQVLSLLAPGDIVRVVSRGRTGEYVVESTHIVGAGDTRWLEPTAEDRLTLLTCYPFGAWGDSGLRYVARAVARGV